VLKSRKDNGGKKGKGKSRFKVFMQTIIGRYLCPGSRAEIAEKATGGNKEKGLYANGRMQTETGLWSL
jgi:hypothetical protein